VETTGFKKKVSESEEDSVYINCSAHGVNGAAVESSKSLIDSIRNQVIQAIRSGQITKDQVGQMHKHLAKELTKMLPSIMKKGSAVSSDGEVYDKETFDADLVHMAVYDHVANGKLINLMPVGPGSSTVN